MGSAPKCDYLKKGGQNHYLVLVQCECCYDFQLTPILSKMHPKRYPTRIPKLYIPGSKSIFREFLVAPSFCEVRVPKSVKNEGPK